MIMNKNKSQKELQEKLKFETYIGQCLTFHFFDNTAQSGRLLANSEDRLLINVMDEGFLELIIFKHAIKHFYKHEI